MKRIVEICSDAVKLRLRGRGSGYKEGPYNRGTFKINFLESDEPLHLCISSRIPEKYKKACSLVQELIINVYEEFKRFCEKSGKQPNFNLNIIKEENVSSRRNQPNFTPLIKESLFVDN